MPGSEDVRKILELARRQLKAGDLEQAEELFRKAIDQGAGSANTWFGLAITLKKRRKFGEALKALETVLTIDEKHELACYEMGLCLLSEQRVKEALAAFDRALNINPRFRQAWFNKASALEILGRFREASVAHEKAGLARDGKEVEAPAAEETAPPRPRAPGPAPPSKKTPMGSARIYPVLTDSIEGLMEAGGGLLVIVTSKIYTYKACLLTLQFLIEEMDMDGVVVSIDKPAPFTLRALGLRSGSRIKPFFVDLKSCQAQPTCAHKAEEGRIVHTDIYDLPAIEEMVEEQLQRAAEAYGGEEHFVLFDDLTSLEFYNSPETLRRFVSSFTEKLKAHNLFAVIILSKEKMKDLFSPIISRSRKRVDLSPDMFQ